MHTFPCGGMEMNTLELWVHFAENTYTIWSIMEMKVLQVHFMKIWTIKMDIVHFSSSPTVRRYIILEFPVPNSLNTNFRVFIQISRLIIDISPILGHFGD